MRGRFEKFFPLYPDIWLTDDKLGLCSYSAKGLWIDILCRMHKSRVYGHLYTNDKPMNKNDVFRLVNFKDADEFSKAWDELINNGVMKQTDEGVFYSKKLIEERQRLEGTTTKRNITSEQFEIMKEVVAHMEKVLERKVFKEDNASTLMHNLLLQGHTKEDFIAVVDFKKSDWWGDSNMEQNLRPRTLFGNNFKRYLQDSKSFQQKGGSEQVKLKTVKNKGFNDF